MRYLPENRVFCHQFASSQKRGPILAVAEYQGDGVWSVDYRDTASGLRADCPPHLARAFGWQLWGRARWLLAEEKRAETS